MHTKEDIKKELSGIFKNLDNELKAVNANTFSKSINGKWSIAQNVDHLTISNNITALSLRMPKAALKQLFKTNQRGNWNYDEVVWKYQLQLSHGAKASMVFQPKISYISVRPVINYAWKNSCKFVLNAIDSWSEQDLDVYVVAHPILGKITIRELLYFTIYHVRHHLNTIQHLR